MAVTAQDLTELRAEMMTICQRKNEKIDEMTNVIKKLMTENEGMKTAMAKLQESNMKQHDEKEKSLVHRKAWYRSRWRSLSSGENGRTRLEIIAMKSLTA